MTQARGYKTQVVLDYETAFGVAPGTPAGVKIPFNTFEVVGSQNLIDPATITGTRNPVAPGKGNLSVSGSVTIPFDSNNIGYWLKALFGEPTTVGASAPYTHTFKVGDTQPSMVLEKGFPDINQYMKYLGCKVKTFKATFGGDGELTASLDIVGATEVVGNTAYMATPTTVNFNRLNNFQASIKEGGSTLATVTSFEINLDMGLDTTNYTIGAQGALGDIPEGIIAANGTIKVLFADATLMNKAINTTETSLELTVAQDVNNSITFLFPEVIYERKTPPISGPGGVSLELNWRAYYANDANASTVKVTLKNAISDY